MTKVAVATLVATSATVERRREWWQQGGGGELAGLGKGSVQVQTRFNVVLTFCAIPNPELNLWSGSAQLPNLGPNFGPVQKSSGSNFGSELDCSIPSTMPCVLHLRFVPTWYKGRREAAEEPGCKSGEDKEPEGMALHGTGDRRDGHPRLDGGIGKTEVL
ncbi:hypothetical protein EDB89DRAFT_2142198 [Lactarius sanguifluus]|nr:hypothetical protein EDB89DRAFT_2142198 [Lactarius sanguifluus]